MRLFTRRVYDAHALDGPRLAKGREMGTWGSGNFEDDSALDWLGDLTRLQCDEIERELKKHDEENGHTIMAAVEVLTMICERLNAVAPRAEQVAAWRTSYVQRFLEYIDELGTTPEFTAERLVVITSTFDRLEAIAAQSSNAAE